MSGVGASRLTLPELGPALGRLVTPPGAPPGPPPAPLPHLAKLRLELVTALFERAGSARQALAEGNARLAAERMGPAAWRALWNDFADRAAVLVRSRIDAALVRAAAESLFPVRRLERLRVTDAEAAGIALRLSGAGAPLAIALEQLNRSFTGDGWMTELIQAARGLEEGWFALEAAAAMEEEAWLPEAVRLRRWHSARWPRRVAAGIVVAGALYAGLVLGGYLPVPGALRPAAQYWWGQVER
ncbi:MAG: hypothetical protein ACHQXA_03425 [Gemmatimonadales bacterium]